MYCIRRVCEYVYMYATNGIECVPIPIEHRSRCFALRSVKRLGVPCARANTKEPSQWCSSVNVTRVSCLKDVENTEEDDGEDP